MSRKRKRNSFNGAFVGHLLEMRESPAWAALPDNARRILDRLEVEHMRHGGTLNGELPCPYGDFEKAGVRRASIPRALRECKALGFIEIVRKGYVTSTFRQPSLYRLTYVTGRGKSPEPTHEWKRITSPEHANAALLHASKPREGTRPKANPGRATAPPPGALVRLSRAGS